MANEFLFEPLSGWEPYNRLLLDVRAHAVVAAYGMSEGQKAHIVSALHRDTGRPVLFVVPSDQVAARAHEDILQMLGGGAALFPAREVNFYQAVAQSHELACRRIETMQRLRAGEAKIVVAPVDALMHRLMPQALFAAHTIRLSEGDVYSPGELAAALSQAGYAREEMVEGKGQFALRGGILDIFPPDALSACRIEFFDDEVDSIRTFDVLTQRSQARLKDVVIPPAAEALVDGKQAKGAADRLRVSLELALAAAQGREQDSLLGSLPMQEDYLTGERYDVAREVISRAARPGTPRERLEGAVRDIADALEEGRYVRGLERYMNLLYDADETILTYMKDPIVVLDEPDHLRERCENRHFEFIEAYKSALERAEALSEQAELLLDYPRLLPKLTQNGAVAMTGFLRTMGGFTPKDVVQLDGTGVSGYQGQLKDLCADMARWQQDGWRIALLSGGVARGQRLLASLSELGAACTFREDGGSVRPGECAVVPLALTHGFQYPQIRLMVISDGDIFGVAQKKTRSRQKKAGEKIAAFTDLKVGDYVVHETHGIGVYQGTVRLCSEGTYRDYLFIQYQGSDKLYVPTDQLDRIQKFIGAEGTAPRINKLGGSEWKRQKAKVKQSIKQLAFDLVKLYAERKAKKGYAFSKDTPWQRQFEENFPFEETPDQLQSIADIKADMESSSTMDRLLCGDVGYGKTEVALRAAFKAVMDGKQVAFLAPTTILVQQHYNTVLKRFEGFPVHAEVISRFKTGAEQKKILQSVKDGSVDILVGTHRLLGKDVVFKDLGLLVVDEEQRFGVAHKESIKNLKSSVDVLTMSATPIPRTLHMSMVGIRDMSLLETPPDERYPVQTYVIEYQDGLIRDAILRELQRGGQVYFLYNRVDTIDQCYAKLSQLVPEARIAIGHGQMREHALEDVMLDFYEHKYDVLLCTTIIESGLDVPNANTLIVYDADHFGLSQLYQLRGRVGRSNRLAYAYLTVRAGKVLSEVSQKRLDAIREFTEFGSGFRIAMRDLELRGAGNILGPEQSGHLSTVGYDMYCKLIEESVREIRGEMGEAVEDIEARVELHVDAFLPMEYVGGEQQRIEVYKKIASIEDSASRDDVEEELIDRFGDEPQPVINLVAIAHLKAMCEQLGIDLILHRGGQLQMRFSPYAHPDGAKLLSAVQGVDKRLILSASQPPSLNLRDPSLSPEEMLHEGVRIMEKVMKNLARN